MPRKSLTGFRGFCFCHCERFSVVPSGFSSCHPECFPSLSSRVERSGIEGSVSVMHIGSRSLDFAHFIRYARDDKVKNVIQRLRSNRRNRRTKRGQRLLAGYAEQEGGKPKVNLQYIKRLPSGRLPHSYRSNRDTPFAMTFVLFPRVILSGV